MYKFKNGNDRRNEDQSFPCVHKEIMQAGPMHFHLFIFIIRLLRKMSISRLCMYFYRVFMMINYC